MKITTSTHLKMTLKSLSQFHYPVAQIPTEKHILNEDFVFVV